MCISIVNFLKTSSNNSLSVYDAMYAYILHACSINFNS